MGIEICDLLSIKLGNMIIKRFSDGEVNIKVFIYLLYNSYRYLIIFEEKISISFK